MRFGYALIILLLISALLILVKAGNVQISASKISVVKMEGSMSTDRWGGIYGFITAGTLDETTDPIFIKGITRGDIDQVNFSASNLLDGKHYLVALPQISGAIDSGYAINTSKIRNITTDDLESWGLFNQSNFPIFHPDYYGASDNPKTTFCCENESLMISGVIYQPFKILLKNNVKFFLLKYEYNSTLAVPIFIVNMSTSFSCLDSSSCNYEMMLPADKTYNFYIISKYPVYDLKVWIDNVETTTFQYSALPYSVKLYAYEKYTGKPAPNLPVGIREIDGNLIFIPEIASGAITEGFAIENTDSNGYANFLIVPTKYASPPTYKIQAVVLIDNDVAAHKDLNVTDIGAKMIKYVSPSGLQIAAMDKIQDAISVANSLKEWMDYGQCYNIYTIDVYTDGSYSTIPSPFVLKTGTPNLVVVNLKESGSGSSVNGRVVVSEFDGILLLHPVNATVTFDSTTWHKKYEHRENEIETGKAFMITPTSYGSADSQVKIKVYDENNTFIAEISATIDRNIEHPPGSSCYISSDMRDRVSNIKWVINNIRYALGG